MKVLFDHQIFASQVYGGVSRYFTEVGERMALLAGIDANVLCPLYVNAYLNTASSLKVHGRQVRRFPNSAIAMRTLNAALSFAHPDVRSRVDVYHETYFSRLDLAPLGAARIVTVHDMIHEKFADSFPALDRTRHAKRTAILRADHVICVSHNTRRDLLDEIDLPEERVSVVYHGSSMGPESTSAVRVRQLLYVGGRGRYKNFRPFLRAFGDSCLPAAGYKVACFGGGTFSSEERAYIAKLGLQNAVEHFGGDDSKLKSLFAESTALVYPSLYEGFGIPPLEAMACGCPVVCSNASSLPEVVGDAALLFDPTDLDAMRTAMETIAESSDLADHLVSAGKARAAGFSWDQSAEATLAAYSKAL